MQRDASFDVLRPDDIRINGHRIGIDDVLGLYLEGYSPVEGLTSTQTLSHTKGSLI